jgi:ribosomal protein S12 methylthiotransferase
MARATEKTIHFVSLGCAKNRVDTEVMLGVSGLRGYRHVGDPSEAEVIVVNTCGFIGPAKEESIDTILEMGEHKSSGKCERLVVAGCLSQRYPEELAAEMPEVDHFLGSSDMLRLGDLLDRSTDARVLVGNPADWTIRATDPRILTERAHSAFVKLAEGCNRSCSFCAIPSIRVKQRSRPVDDVVREITALAQAGVVVVNLVSQDTVA